MITNEHDVNGNYDDSTDHADYYYDMGNKGNITSGV